jgi:hypothetical protein
MGLQDEIEPILASIGTAAAEHYERYLSSIPDKHLHPEIYAKDRQDFSGMVADLCTRFREFYALDSHDFTANVSRLSTPIEQKPRPLVSYPSPGTAFASLVHADAAFMRPVVEMIHTEQWNSPAATAFRDNFLVPFETAADWQGAYIKELAVAAETYRNTVDKTKKAIRFVADGCLAAFRGRPIHEPAEGGDWRSQLGAFSLLAAAVALFLPASAASLAVGSISLASGLASLPLADDKPYLRVEYSEYPQAIIRDAENAIKQLNEMVLDVDEALGRGLTEDLDSPDAFASRQLRLERADVDADTYKTLDIRDGDGKPPNQVVVSLVALGRAGYVNLPGAAYEYDLARAQVDACEVPAGLSRFFPRSAAPFNDACRRLSAILLQTSDDLTDAGAAMLASARGYQATDEERAQVIGELNQITPHHSRAPFH